MAKRVTVTPLQTCSIRDLRFRRPRQDRKQIDFQSLPARTFVLEDLKRGHLDTLIQYLRERDDPLDRDVAETLRDLWEGDSSRSKYRILVIDHPESSKSKGGRPKRTKASDGELEVAFQNAFAAEGKRYLALERVSKRFGRSLATVKRALKRAEKRREKSLAERVRSLKNIDAELSKAAANLRAWLVTRNLRKFLHPKGGGPTI